MIRQDFTLANGWHVRVYCLVTAVDDGVILRDLEKIGCEEDTADEIRRNIAADKENFGFTYSNTDIDEAIMVIGIASSAKEFFNTLIHEIGHLTRHISKSEGFDPYGEEEQYLQGEIAMEVYPIVGDFLCEDCRVRACSDVRGYQLFSDVFKFM